MVSNTLKPSSQILFTAGLLLLLSASLLLLANHLLWGEWSFDQGYYLLIAKLLTHGYQPYSEIFMSEPPLMVWSIGPALNFFDSVAGMQLVMVGYAILGIAAMVSIGVSLDGKVTGLLAGLLLAFNYTYFFYSVRVMPEIPSMSLALVSMALALRYHTSGHWVWLVGSGVALAGSFLIKYFMPWLTPLIVLIITLPPGAAISGQLGSILWRQRRQVLQNWLVWGGAMLGTILVLSSLTVNLYTLIDQTILFHLFKSAGTERDLASNIDKIWQTFLENPVLSACALLGLGVAINRFKQTGWIVAATLLLCLMFLLLYSPLRSKHLVLLAPVLALLAAHGLGYLFSRRQAGRGSRNPTRWATVVGGGLLLALLLADMATPYEALAKPPKSMIDDKMQPLVLLLDQFTSPADCLVTDNPYLAFVSNRLPPPWFSALSYARFESGSLSMEEMVAITNADNCPVMAPVLDRIKNANRPYYDWAKSIYMRTWLLDGKEIMLGKPLQNVQPERPLAANFSGQVELRGADWYPGQNSGHLSLYWHTLQPFSEDFKIFVQLRDQTGQTVASADHEAFNGLLPTRLWYADRTLKVTNRLSWPADLPPGRYGLYVGMYHPATGQRLPIEQDASGEHAVVIPDFVVTE